MRIRIPTLRALSVVLSLAIAADSVAPLHAGDVWSDRRSRHAQLARLPVAPMLPLPPVSALSVGVTRKPALNGISLPAIADLPANIGAVRRTVRPAGAAKATVVLIQDVHRNPEAQLNIAAAVRHLSSTGAVELVALEGAWGPVDLQAFRAFPDGESMAEAADILLRQNVITGPVRAAIAQPALSIVGVDDPSLHRANADAVRAAAARRPLDLAALTDERRVVAAQTEALPAGHRSLIEAADRYRSGQLPVGSYLAALSRAGGRPGPEITRFLEAHRLERSLNFPSVEAQRSAFLARLVERLTPEEARRLLADGAAFRAGSLTHAAFYERLETLGRSKGVRFDDQPALAAYLSYVRLADRIDGEALMREIRGFESGAFDALDCTTGQRAVIDRAARLRERAALIGLSLTPDDWRSARARAGDGPHAEFYRRAESRDEAMAANLLRAMEESHARAAALVVGGFHAPGIARRLADRGVAVAMFVPSISRVELANGTEYLNAFTREKSPLDRLFDGPKLFLAEQVMTGPARARLGILGAAIAFRKNFPAASLVAFLERGLGWAGVRLSSPSRDVVRVEGDAPLGDGGRARRAVEVGIRGASADLRAVPVGVWDAWRPLWRIVRDEVRLRNGRPRLLIGFLALVGMAEELATRPVIAFLLVPGAVAVGLAPVAAWSVAIGFHAIVSAFILHWHGVFAWSDGTDRMWPTARSEIFVTAVAFGAVQALVSGIAPAWAAIVVVSVLHAGHTIGRFGPRARAIALPAGPPITGVAEALAILGTNVVNQPEMMPRVLEAIDWLERNPSRESIDALTRFSAYAWVGDIPLLGVRIRQAMRANRHAVNPDSGPSRRVHRLAALERVILSDTRTLREKADAIEEILDNPGSQDLAILSDALFIFRERNPRLAALLIDAIAKVRATGVLTQGSAPHRTIRSRVRQALAALNLNRSHFSLAYLDNGRTLELRWRYPAGETFAQAEQLRAVLRQLYTTENEAVDPEITVIDTPGAMPPGNQGAIRMAFHPNMANLSDFQRSLGVDELVRGRDGRFRRRTAIEVAGLIEDQTSLFLAGLPPADPQRAELINAVFGDGRQPGIAAAVRDIQRFGGARVVPVESYDEIDPDTNEPRSARREPVGPMQELGNSLPYMTHYIPEFDVSSWVFFGRAAAPYFTAASLKGFLRNHVEKRDHVVIVSRDTVSRKLWLEIHSEIIRLLADLETSEPSVPNFAAVRLVTGQWLRRRYYLSPEISVGGMRGVLRYRQANAVYDDDGFLVEQIPIYDGVQPNAQQIAMIQRRRDLSTDGPPEYVGLRPGAAEAAPWQPISNADVAVTGDEPNAGLWAHVIRMVSDQVAASGALDEAADPSSSPEPVNVVLVDEIGWGTFPVLTAFALEQLGRRDEQDVPPEPELLALRLQDPFTLTPAQVERWRTLERGYRASRQLPGRRPVEAEVFIGAPPLYMSLVLQYLNPFNYPSVDQMAIVADYGESFSQAGLIMQSGTSVADQVGHSYFVDTADVRGNPFRQGEAILGRPILGQRIPIDLESEVVQIGSYLKDLYIYNGVVRYYEKEYERLAVRPLLLAIREGTAEVRAKALEAISQFEFPSAIRGLVAAAADDRRLAPEVAGTAGRLLERHLANALDIHRVEGARLLNLELLIEREPLLQELAAESNPLSDMRNTARLALEVLAEARAGSRVMGVPVERYVEMSGEQKDAMRLQGIFAAPVVSADPQGQAEELERAAAPLGIANREMAPAGWNPPTAEQAAEILAAVPPPGGLIPRVTRAALWPFIAVMAGLIRLPAHRAIALYRFLGGGLIEEGLVAAVPVLAAVSVTLAAGAPSSVIAAAVAAAGMLGRALFLAAHPRGTRAGAAVIATVAVAALLTAPFTGADAASTVALAVIPGLAAHVAWNAATDILRSPEERMAERVAMALMLADRGRPRDAAAAISDLLGAAGARLDVESIARGAAVERLSAATAGANGWNGPAFASALARQMGTLAGRPMTAADAMRVLQSVSRGELDRPDVSTLGAELDRIAPRDAGAAENGFVHLVVTDAEASRAADLLRVTLSRRTSPAERILVSATSERAFRLVAAAAPAGVEVRRVDATPSGQRLTVRVADLPAELNGARVRALIVAESIELDMSGVDDNSPYRTVAVLLINLALKAVRLPALGEMERAARLIATQS